jgi:hypothetical protein
MRKIAFGLLIAALPATALHAQAMPVSTFLAKAEALKKKGPLALLSGDVGLLKAEVMNSGKALRAEQLAAQKAGQKPATCIPEKAAIGSNELLNHFQAISAQQRNMSVKAAFASLMRKKYPCSA